jgi:hypothetical protein
MMCRLSLGILLLKLYVLLFYRLQAIETKNVLTFRLENLKKEFRRPRRIREENFKNGLGERGCKKVDSTMCLS